VPLLLSPFGYSTYREAEGQGAGVGAEAAGDRYGKSAVRMTKCGGRGDGRHELIELEVAIALEGDFETAHTRGTTALCCRPTP